MSSEKFEIISIDSIIARLKNYYSIDGDKELADIMGIKQGTFSAKKKTGTIFNDISYWCVLNKLDTGWILNGTISDTHKYDIVRNLESFIDEYCENDTKIGNIWFKVNIKDSFDKFLKWLEVNEEDSKAEGKKSQEK